MSVLGDQYTGTLGYGDFQHTIPQVPGDTDVFGSQYPTYPRVRMFSVVNTPGTVGFGVCNAVNTLGGRAWVFPAVIPPGTPKYRYVDSSSPMTLENG